MSGAGTPAGYDDLWQPTHWRDRPGGPPLNGFASGLVLLAVAWNLIGNLWLPSTAWVPANLLLASALVAIAFRVGVTPEELGLRRDRLRRGLVVGGAAVLTVLAVLTVAVALPATRTWFDDARVAADDGPSRVFHILIRIPLGTVIFEEVLFRGAFLALALRRWSVATAVAVTAVLFGLWHVVPAAKSAADGGAATIGAVVGTVVVTTLAGGAFAWLRLRANSLLASLLAHAATNSLAYLAAVIALALIR